MSSWSGSQNCPNCCGKDSLMTMGSNRPYDSSSGICLECGFSYSTQEKQLSLNEVNAERDDYDLEPIKALKPRMP